MKTEHPKKDTLSRPLSRPAALCLALVLAAAMLAGCAANGGTPYTNSSYSGVQRDTPPQVLAALEEAESLVESGRPDAAMVVLSAAQSVFGYNAGLMLAKGRILESIDQPDRAREAYEAVLLREPNQADVLQAMGILHLREGRVELAGRMLSRAANLDRLRVRKSAPSLDVDKRSPLEVYSALGIIADQIGEHEAASDYFILALQIRKTPLLYNNLGYSRYLSGNYGAAEWAYEQALELDPEYAPALRNLALLVGRRGDYAGASGLLAQAENETEVLLDLADIARAGGEPNRASQYLARARVESQPADRAPVTTEVMQLAAPVVEERAGNTRFVIAEALKVRDQGSPAGDVIAWLSQGTAVQVLEDRGRWSRVRFMRGAGRLTEGWVHSGYLGDSTG